MLSYGWTTRAHCDPHGATLEAVRHYLKNHPDTHTCALFWDFCSLFQGPDRTKSEKKQFDTALNEMGRCYASMAGTTVLQLKDVPEKATWGDEYIGRVNLTGLSGQSEEELSKMLGKFGDVKSCPINRTAGEACVKFASEDAAQRCIKEIREGHDERLKERLKERTGLKEGNDPGINAFSAYHDVPYDDRGWPTFEQGTARTVAAHLKKAYDANSCRSSCSLRKTRARR